MSLAEKIRTFNDLVESFLKQMSPIIGTTYHHYFTKLIRFNAVMPIQNFIYYAIPLKQKILDRDESYFTNVENHEQSAKEVQNATSDPLDEIIRLKGIFEKLSSESKDNVWDMTQAMLIIAMEYLELKK
jgi:hypothetical protein